MDRNSAFAELLLTGQFFRSLLDVTQHYKPLQSDEHTGRELGSRGTRIALNLVSSQDSLFEK
jgi:hypothetical protein